MRVTITLNERDAGRFTGHQVAAGFERPEDFALGLVQQSLRERDKARQAAIARREMEQDALRASLHRRQAPAAARDDATWRGFLGGF